MVSLVKRHKVISVVVLLNLILIAVVIAVIAIHNAKTATVDIKVAPSEATIELNGAKYDNFNTYDVLPGDYHVKISMEGMQTKEYDFEIENNGFVRVNTYLVGEDGSFDYYLAHPEDEEILADVVANGGGDVAAEKFVAEDKGVVGILDELPINYDAYADDFAYYTNYTIERNERDDCPKIICLTIIDRTGESEQAAIDKIKEMGFDPDNYEINYEYKTLESARAGNE